MSELSRDNWSKAEVFMGIFLPLTIASIGGVYTYVQDKNTKETLVVERQRDENKLRADKLTSLIEHLSSENKKQRLIGLAVADHLSKQNQLPAELIPVLKQIIQADESPEVSAAATQVVAQTTEVTAIGPQGSAVKIPSSAEENLSQIAPRIYIHIRNETQRSQAEQLSSTLQASGFLVPGIQKVEVAPNNTQIRYFTGNTQPDLKLIKEVLDKADYTKVALVDLSARYQNSTSIRPRHYELWLGATSQQ